MDIRAANQEFEYWLRAELRGKVVEDDLKAKHKGMRRDAFTFLRATYWRWAEKIFEVCPDLAAAPAVPAVGDTHLENFGTWTDEEGRIVWGINDYDEAAEMPYLLDLVRLAASAALATTPRQMSLHMICDRLMQGYSEGLKTPEALVLDRDNLWLRKRFVVNEKKRVKFWRHIQEQHDKLKKRKNKRPEQPPVGWSRQFAAALPHDSPKLVFWRHTAGTGSLGRPRWLGYGIWRSAPLLREAKALVPSTWNRAHGGKRLSLNAIAQGLHRAPDPWYAAQKTVLVRRLSPNNRKIDVESEGDVMRLLHPDLLWYMGRDLAGVHLGLGDYRGALRKDFATRKARWFRACVEAASDFVAREYAEWKKSS
jgi:Uncharacterized protein conserved in bacteria (DUF2252)